MRELRPYGFVRGVSGDRHPYRDTQRFSNIPLSGSRQRVPSVREQNPRIDGTASGLLFSKIEETIRKTDRSSPSRHGRFVH